MNPPECFCKFFISQNISHFPAGNVKHFPERINGKTSFPDLGMMHRAGKFNIVKMNQVVNFIGNYNDLGIFDTIPEIFPVFFFPKFWI